MSPSKAQGDATKERILRVGTRLFAARGYHGTGITELSKEVGLGRGALYHHIASKEDLLYLISLDLLRRMIAEGEAIVAEHDDAEAALRALARALVLEHATNRDAWALVITEVRSLTDEHRDKVVAERNRYEAIWGQQLAKATKQGAIRKTDVIELRAVLGMLNSTARWVSPDGELAPAKVADRYMDLLMAGLRPRAD